MEYAMLVLGSLSLLGLGGALMSSIARNDQLLRWNRNEARQKLEAHEISRGQKAKIKVLTREIELLQAEHARHITQIADDHKIVLLRQRQAHILALAAQAADKDRAVSQALEGVDEAYRDRIRALEWSLFAMLEPEREDCTKIRFHHKEDAERFARELEIQDGLPEGFMEPYACRVCPRSPWTIEKYFHVTSGGMSKEIRSAIPRPNRLAGRITPTHIAALKKRVNGAT